MDDLHFDPSLRHDFLLLVEAFESNPNGDPDYENRPRQDPHTDQGLISPGSIKRHVRDWMIDQGEDVLIQPGEESLQSKTASKASDGGEVSAETLLQRCIDVRLFGHTATKTDIDVPTGPVQIPNARSVGRIYPRHQTITRCMKTTDEDENHGMGRQYVVPYSIYRAEGAYMPAFIGDSEESSGRVASEDLRLLYQGLLRGWRRRMSSSRPSLEGVLLAVITHSSARGEAKQEYPFDEARSGTFDVVRCENISDPPTGPEDYEIDVDTGRAPEGTEAEVVRPHDGKLD